MTRVKRKVKRERVLNGVGALVICFHGCGKMYVVVMDVNVMCVVK